MIGSFILNVAVCKAPCSASIGLPVRELRRRRRRGGAWGGKVSSVGPSCHVRVHRVDILKNLRAHGSRGEPGVFSLKKKKPVVASFGTIVMLKVEIMPRQICD